MVTTLTAYNAFHEGGSSYIQCIIRLVTDIEAMTEFKHSSKWIAYTIKTEVFLEIQLVSITMACDRE